ncbi:hypothetical protein O1611_g239 [Lasiodiplodia mahajangana]|uniref:Uncharacterized protein n=1 Tax=Lasiodiplodia mahajangana TaxID=1108764 RepID=A0ACC2K107_9PEZI|nr:hypothetical protein O1611_g239 [Lasiodiplodia mahajangana]
MLPGECKVEGDGDLYGLGVRLGSYLQWLALLLACHLAPANVPNAWLALNAFQFGVFVTISWRVATHDNSSPLYNIDLFIALWFGTGGNVTSQIGALLTASNQARRPTIAIYFSTTTSLGFSAMSLWFWFVGIDTLDQPICRPIVFFFFKVYLHGWFITFNRVITAVGLAATALNAIYVCWDGVVQLRHRRLAEQLRWLLVSDEATFTFPIGRILQPPKKPPSRIAIGVGQTIAWVFFVLAIELSITWSHIVGVNSIASTGQIIPLVIGLILLLQNLQNFFLLENWRADDEEAPKAIYAVEGVEQDSRAQPWRKYLDAEQKEGNTKQSSWKPDVDKPWEKPWIEWRSELAGNDPATQGS